MKEHELRTHATCSLCRKAIGAAGLPLFWRVTIDRFGIDARAVRRQDALASMLGSSTLAGVMGPSEELATPVMDTVTLTVCETCAVARDLPVAALAEVSHG